MSEADGPDTANTPDDGTDDDVDTPDAADGAATGDPGEARDPGEAGPGSWRTLESWRTPERSGELLHLAGSALVVIGAVGLAAWLWRTGRRQLLVGEERILGVTPDDPSVGERIDLLMNDIRLLVEAAGVAAIGLLVRLRLAPADPSPRRVHTRLVWGLGLAALAVLVTVLVVASRRDADTDRLELGDVGDLDDLGSVLTPERATDILGRDAAPLPRATLTVFSDGCGVIRSELENEPDPMQWTVTDMDGFDVFGGNALGETHFRYYRPGTYTVVLEAWGSGSYAPISNAVTIHC